MAYKRIGIIGGVGPSATVLYYQRIIIGYRERRGDEYFPEMVIHSLDMGEINEYFEKEEFGSLSDKLVQAVEGLQKAGCEFALLACNAMHMVFDRVQERISLPMVNLIEAVLGEVKRRKFKRVGLMGTTFVMRHGLYRQPLELSGIQCLLPDKEEQAWIMKAILEDLQNPHIPQETIARLLKNVERLGEQGAEAVILACTDLPVAMSEELSPLPLLDSTKIHVEAILDFALGNAK